MKRVLLIAALLVLLGSGMEARYKAGYYNLMNGKKKEALKQAAKECVSRHTTLEYYSLPNYWQYSDVYPQLVNGSKRWWDMYSDAIYLIKSGQSGTSSFSANKMQREHSVPKSWWSVSGNVEYTPAYSDMWNLYPSDGAANQAKLNYPLGVTDKTSFNNGVTKVGDARSGYGGGSGKVFEPADQYKGDFARAYLYMATVYDDLKWAYKYMFVDGSYPSLQPWAINMLLEWSRRDPVSQKEIDRNDVVEQYQGNRNPFVDFPELAEYIWGSRTTETFLLSEQGDIDPTPPVTGDPEIIQPVSGESLDFGQVAVGMSQSRVLQIVGKNLTSPLSVLLAGADKGCFQTSVKSIPAATINQSQGYLFNIVYTPTSPGQHTAKLTLYDGGIKGSIAVTLIGEALERPEFETLTAMGPTEITDSSYTASWNPVSEGKIADYYLLTRVRYADGNEEVETYETGETSYQLTGRQVGVAESYYVQYSRLGMLSKPSNVIYVSGNSSVDQLCEGMPIQVKPVEGGFIIRVYGESQRVTISQISGMIYRTISAPSDGEEVQLPAGIYVVTAPGMRPVKITITN